MDMKLLNETIDSISDLHDEMTLNQLKAKAYLNKNDEVGRKLYLMVGRLMDLATDYKTPENWEE